MRKINVREIRNTVRDLCISANIKLRNDIREALKKSIKKETKPRAKYILKILLENAVMAEREDLAICQDTGLAVIDLALGQDVRLLGGDLIKAINDGVKDGYNKGYFRKSIVLDPLTRRKTPVSHPAVIYLNIVKGNKVKITVSPKGFGSENKSKIKMLNPTDGEKEIKEFVLNTVKDAGPNACPPFILGVGIGGTFDGAALLAKKALFRNINKRNPKLEIRKLENNLLKAINKLNIGPMGLGGKTTCLGVNILEAPTHIAGLPVAVNVSCHATRSKTTVI